MALWTGSFTEDAYRSRLDYSIDRNDLFHGRYAPPTRARTGSSFADLNLDCADGTDVGLSLTLEETHGPGGLSALEGTVEMLEDDVIRITGSWKHMTRNTPFHHLSEGGRFEMCSKKGSTRECIGPMQGNWWVLGDEKKHSWVWNTESFKKIEEGCTPRQLVQSVYMDRFGMACGWLFFVKTSIQLVSFGEEWIWVTDMNLAFNIDYSVLYFMFLLTYVALDAATRPHWTYIMGVLLYCLGYVLFAGLCGEVGNAKFLYHGGSWLFLVGSLFLMYATALKKMKEYNPLKQSSALFWGSTCFLIGSACFAMDAASSGLGTKGNGLTGFALFALGRIFFIRGSQTPRCSVLFMKNT